MGDSVISRRDLFRGGRDVGGLFALSRLLPEELAYRNAPVAEASTGLRAGSEVYHDYYRWPARDRRVFEGWLAKTPWGTLFQEYHRVGALRALLAELQPRAACLLLAARARRDARKRGRRDR